MQEDGQCGEVEQGAMHSSLGTSNSRRFNKILEMLKNAQKTWVHKSNTSYAYIVKYACAEYASVEIGL